MPERQHERQPDYFRGDKDVHGRQVRGERWQPQGRASRGGTLIALTNAIQKSTIPIRAACCRTRTAPAHVSLSPWAPMPGPPEQAPGHRARGHGCGVKSSRPPARAGTRQPLRARPLASARATSRPDAVRDRHQTETNASPPTRSHYYAAKAPGSRCRAARFLPREGRRSGGSPLTTRSGALVPHPVDDGPGRGPPAPPCQTARRRRCAQGWGSGRGSGGRDGTMLLPYASLFFAHDVAAMLGFAAFALVWIERAKPARLRTLWLAGALAGLAVFVEYPVALIGLVVGLFAITRRPVLERGIVCAAGFLVGVVPSPPVQLPRRRLGDPVPVRGRREPGSTGAGSSASASRRSTTRSTSSSRSAGLSR